MFFRRRKIYFWLAALIFLTGCSGGKPVATVQSETEAIEIIDVLRENEIAAEKQEIGDERAKQFRVTIQEESIGGDTYAAAIQILRDHCLPHRDPPPIEDTGYITSIEAEKAKIQRQTRMNIIGQLRKLPGVTCVDVNFVLPQEQFTTNAPYPATAAVTIGYKTAQPAFDEAKVKNLVASSVPNLQPDKVTVLLSAQPVRPLPPPNRNALGRFLLVGGVGLIVILGSVLLIYFLQKRRRAAALARRADDFSAEIVE